MLHRPVLLLCDPTDIERVLVTEHHAFIKPVWLRTPAVLRLLGDGLVAREGAVWRHQRQVCQPAFQLRRMDAYGERIAAIALNRLAHWEPGQTRDLQEEMAQFTLEIVADTLFDIRGTDWIEKTCAAMNSLMARFTAERNLFGMIPWPPAPEEIRATRQLNSVADLLIRRHAQPGPTRTDNNCADLLTLLRRPVPEGGEGLQGRRLREQVKTFLATGYESSALALTWVFWLLAQHPDIETTLITELKTVLKGRPPIPADLPHLPYTQAVVQETLRLYPPLWMTGRQPVDSCEIGGVRVQAGTLIMTSQWVVQRLPQFFTFPDVFRPERWLNGETASLPRYAYFPFGGGPRVCIGQSFALLETVLLLASIAQRFRLELLPGPPTQPRAAMTLRPSGPIPVHLHTQHL